MRSRVAEKPEEGEEDEAETIFEEKIRLLLFIFHILI